MDLKHSADRELLEHFVQDGDRFALGLLVHRYQSLVWNVCRRALTNRSDAEDAFQMTFLVLAEKADKIRKPDSLGNWLYGVARRVSSDIRKRKLVTGRIPDSVAEDTNSVLLSITRQHEIDLVDQQLQAMPEKHRTPLLLRYFSGLSAQEIADQLELSVSAAEGRLRRSRLLLKQMLLRAGWNDREIGTASWSCVSLFALLAPPTAILEATIARLTTTVEEVHGGFQMSQFSLGTKLMLCKFACSTGIALLMAITAWLHGPPTTVAQVSQDSISISAASDQGQETPGIAIEATTDATTHCLGYQLCSSVCENLGAMPSCCHEHLTDLCKLIHGESEYE